MATRPADDLKHSLRIVNRALGRFQLLASSARLGGEISMSSEQYENGLAPAAQVLPDEMTRRHDEMILRHSESWAVWNAASFATVSFLIVPPSTPI